MSLNSKEELEHALVGAQADAETERSALARILHDDFGGLLVGAIMDIGWVLQHGELSEPANAKLTRANALLRAAIDMKRELIEKLRPTLLDNVGLFSTLKWHLKASCNASDVPFTEKCPPNELALEPEVRIGVFRIFQEALKHVLAQEHIGELALEIRVVESTLHCRLSSIHLQSRPGGTPIDVPPEASMHQRARPLSGTVQWRRHSRGHQMDLQIPLKPGPSAPGSPDAE